MAQLSKVLKVVCWAGSVPFPPSVPAETGCLFTDVAGVHVFISGESLFTRPYRLLVALWFGKDKPPMKIFMRPVCEELEKLHTTDTVSWLVGVQIKVIL